MLCEACRSDNPEGNRFCGNCGSPLTRTCPNCSAANPPTGRFCSDCGHPLGEAAVDSSPPATPERRLVTVLFADLTGYTTFAEDRDAEEVRSFLGRYFETCRKEVERFGGVVEKFIGDAVMAVWGAETANEDDAERAVRTGFELVDIVAKLSADVGASGLALRVGIHTGEAAVGPATDRMGFVTGDLVNTASRLQAVADPGTVLVGESTRSAASSSIVFEPVGAQALKGKSLPVEAWRALRVVSERRGRGRTEMLEPPFTGRSNELRLLKDLLETVGEESRSRLVSLVGEAGIGKSRLVWELLKYVDGLAETIYWHEGRSPSYGDGVTYWAVAEMIKGRAGILDEEGEDRLEKLDQSLASFLADPAERTWARPRLAAILGLGDAPPGDRAELHSAVRAFFEGVAEQGTTVLVFEDLHWADPALLEFVEELPDWWRTQPILIVTMARPDLLERRPSWGTGRQGVISMTLGPLSEREMSEMVTETVPGLPRHAVEMIVTRSAGIPLYAVELLRSLLAHGELEGSSGAYRVVGELGEIAVPESLQAVIGARLDRLDPDSRALVQDAAVLGHSFSRSGLAVLSGRDPEDLNGLLHELVRREIVEPIRDPRSPERGQYQFLQGLIRDVALGRMARETRRARHLAAAEYLESQQDPELAVVVASHYLQALEAMTAGAEQERLRIKALASMADAAQRAAGLRAYDQVLSIADKALQLAGDDGERAPFWEWKVEAAASLGEIEVAERFGRLALDHHRASGDETGAHRAARKLALAYSTSGHPARAIELLGPLLGNKEKTGQDPDLARAAQIMARALGLNQNTEAALATADDALEATERLGLVTDTVEALITKGTVLGHLGRLTEARILLEGAIALADRNDLLLSAARGRNNLGYILVGIDDGAVRRNGIEAYETALRSGERSQIVFHSITMADGHFLDGDFAAAERLLDHPVVAEPAPEAAVRIERLRMAMALWRGDIDQARRHHQMILRHAEQVEDKQVLRSAEIASSELILFTFDLETAFDRAMAGIATGWSEAQDNMEVALLAAALLGDTGRLERWAEAVGAHRPRFTRMLEPVEALLRYGDDERGFRQVEEMLVASDAAIFPLQGVALVAVVGLLGPPARRQPHLDKAIRIATERGWNGFLALLEAAVSPPGRR